MSGAGLATAPIEDAPAAASDERVTPQWLFDALHREFHFRLDAAAQATNAKVPLYCGLDHWLTTCRDGLTADWYALCALAAAKEPEATRSLGHAVWVNPPYSRGSILRWARKAEDEAAKGLTVVMLLPADTSTHYFHDFAMRHERRFLKQRLKFEGAPLDRTGKLPPAKFGSVVVVVRPSHRLWTWG